jgi:hypothetical protein
MGGAGGGRQPRAPENREQGRSASNAACGQLADSGQGGGAPGFRTNSCVRRLGWIERYLRRRWPHRLVESSGFTGARTLPACETRHPALACCSRDAKKMREADAKSSENIITSRTKFYAALAKARLDSWKKN